MKKFVVVLCMLCLLFQLPIVSAVGVTTFDTVAEERVILDSGQCGETLYWELDSEGLLRIFGSGPMYDYNKYYEPSPWYKYRNEPYISEDGTKILDTDGGVYLSADGYYANNPKGYKISNILIEDGVTYLGDWAFYRVCVEEITVPETVEATGIFCFRYSPTLKKLTLPDSLKFLDDYAISRNYALETVHIGNSLETVGTAGFNNNPSLKEIILPKTCTSINKQQSPTYASIDYSKVGLMENCSSLEYVSFGSVTDIPQRTCLGAALKKVVIPNTVKSIGEYAFYTCTDLTEVIFEDGSVCTQINSTAFASCSSLERVKGGVSLEKMGSYTSVSSLVEFDFSDTNKELQKSQFLGTSLKEVKVSDNITVIPVSCFNSMKKLERIYLPDTITEIMGSSFNFCESLKDIYFDGTRAQWARIKKASGWNYKVNPECMLHFSDGTSVSLWYTPVKYSVTFVDYDGTVISTQQVEEGCDATAPQVLEREYYTFTGWDKDFTNITADTEITAQYRRISGVLRVDIIGGTGFTISVNNGTERPQGGYYVNSAMPMGSLVTLTAKSTADNEFIGWLRTDNNSILSEDLSYTFYTSGNDSVKAVFCTPVDGVSVVMFKNDKQNKIIDMQYYKAGDEIIFPDAPMTTGYDFDGWDHTEEEIQEKLTNGEDVTVFAKWKVKPVYFGLTVNSGRIISHGTVNEDGKYLAYRAVTVEADTAEEGMKFAFWKDQKGKVRSYDSIYKFYIAEETELTAVYVAEDTQIDYEILVDVVMDTAYENDSNNIIFSWSVPERETGLDFVKAGILLVKEDNYNELTFEVGTKDSNVIQYYPNEQYQLSTNSYSVIKTAVNSGDAWVVKAWVQYFNTKGELCIAYSDAVVGTKL